ncbi:hypothetical protein WICMUC_003110 [Wickerhamomyces mucosus]|uniref:Uncharacterized protein n=1 Tax=Wickerhamomyces mucosus TaxID=1378264 RepID=A0A9P8PNN2_9ASCO|nr:hypothetical protein WICMUC_003110 [Wickerhamomyces mucosus]
MLTKRARSPGVPDSTYLLNKSNGDQNVTPYIDFETDEARIPIKEVNEKQNGIAKNCDKPESPGFLANLEKSGEFKTKVEKFARADIAALIKAQA